ncbi:MAG TPA: 3-oxoacyl-ACP reductase FabG [Syntrophomonadaceae bacterium]|nr:3-oxoacyl-ACP reductase FabG [Syntrophomonadaceae bacterium]HOQ09033.1 3-oxoacyl-ACP reductase FabG [Syntrophomonadaceae bacterium]HPU47955.1 3-oxoacyl-ACP reductase FabG [Syntrophomonadaceae bacterium]
MADLLLQGKICLVTGASRGIGAAIARAAAAAGAMVAINYCRSRNLAESLAEELRNEGGQAMAIQADVGSSADVERMFATVEKAWGPVSLLVNNAGVSLRELVTHTSEDQWDQVINTNLKGPFLCCRRALPHMIRSRWGRIINIASVWGMRGASCESVYAASKGGLILFTKSLAQEVGPSGVTVNALAPGPIGTDMLADELTEAERQDLAADIPLGRLGSPEDVAKTVIFLLSEGGNYINGQVITVDGGWTA